MTFLTKTTTAHRLIFTMLTFASTHLFITAIPQSSPPTANQIPSPLPTNSQTMPTHAETVESKTKSSLHLDSTSPNVKVILDSNHSTTFQNYSDDITTMPLQDGMDTKQPLLMPLEGWIHIMVGHSRNQNQVEANSSTSMPEKNAFENNSHPNAPQPSTTTGKIPRNNWKIRTKNSTIKPTNSTIIMTNSTTELTISTIKTTNSTIKLTNSTIELTNSTIKTTNFTIKMTNPATEMTNSTIKTTNHPSSITNLERHTSKPTPTTSKIDFSLLDEKTVSSTPNALQSVNDKNNSDNNQHNNNNNNNNGTTLWPPSPLLSMHLTDEGHSVRVSWTIDLSAINNLDLVKGFVVSYKMEGRENYDSSRLGGQVRTFILHSLHMDKHYSICVRAIGLQHEPSVPKSKRRPLDHSHGEVLDRPEGEKLLDELCMSWSKTSMKLVMGVIAGLIFLVPCLMVIVWVVYKDRKMSDLNSEGDQEYQTRNGRDVEKLVAKSDGNCHHSHSVKNGKGRKSCEENRAVKFESQENEVTLIGGEKESGDVEEINLVRELSEDEEGVAGLACRRLNGMETKADGYGVGVENKGFQTDDSSTCGME